MEDSKDETFEDFARKLLEKDEFKKRLEAHKANPSKNYFSNLRTALLWNTKVRIQAVAYAVMNTRYDASVSKSTLVGAVIDSLSSLLVEIPEEVSQYVADIGIMEVEVGGTIKHEIVLLRANGHDDSYEPCVHPLEYLDGWVIRDKHAQRDDMIPLSKIAYGRLVEKRKDITL